MEIVRKDLFPKTQFLTTTGPNFETAKDSCKKNKKHFFLLTKEMMLSGGTHCFKIGVDKFKEDKFRNN